MSLYWDDPYRLVFDSSVASVSDEGIILDDNYFYPAGGGQPHDTGFIQLNGDKFDVLSAKKTPQGVLLEIRKPHNIKQGSLVRGVIDAKRRKILMRMHTAAHIISAIIIKKTGALITGNQLGCDISRVDYELDNFNPDFFKALEDEINSVIASGIRVETLIVRREDAVKQLDSLSTLKMGLPDHIRVVRLVKIGDIDIQACGGTHVKNTSEIGSVSFVKFKNKGRNNRRVYFSVE